MRPRERLGVAYTIKFKLRPHLCLCYCCYCKLHLCSCRSELYKKRTYARVLAPTLLYYCDSRKWHSTSSDCCSCSCVPSLLYLSMVPAEDDPWGWALAMNILCKLSEHADRSVSHNCGQQEGQWVGWREFVLEVCNYSPSISWFLLGWKLTNGLKVERDVV